MILAEKACFGCLYFLTQKSREPDKETVSVCTTSEALSQELSSWPLGESEPDSVKEWEGWQTRYATVLL